MSRWAPLLALSLLLLRAFAAKPELEHLYPAGAPRNSTHVFELSGKFEPWPPNIWSNAEGLSFQFETNKGNVHIAVSAGAEPGPVLVRLFNNEGASEPRIFVIGDGDEIADAEPNDHFRKPQSISHLPVTVNGRLDRNGDVDSFAFDLEAGQWLDARLDSYTLMGKVDPVLRLLDTNGYQLAWNHDHATLDPRLQWQAPTSQRVILQVFGFAYPANAQIQLSGGPGGVYRLHLNVHSTSPALGWPQAEAELSSAEAGLQLPTALSGVICPEGDEDRFRLVLKKDQYIEAQLDAAVLGSPLDAWLKIEDSSGKELVRNDDFGATRDPRLEWKAPADGEYYLIAGSVTHKGREDYRYRLSVRELQPDYRATIDTSSIVIKAGETNEVKMKIERLRGLTNELVVRFESLPEGLSAEPLAVPDKGGEISLKLIAAADAPALNQPARLLVNHSGEGTARPVQFELTSRTIDNGVPGGYTSLLVDRTDLIWLTVSPAQTVPHVLAEK